MSAFDPVLLLLAALGHLAVTFFLINVSHGSGVVSPWLNRLTIVFLAASGLGVAGAVWWFWALPFDAWPRALQIYGGLCSLVAVVGIPADAVRRWLRRDPAGITTRWVDLDFKHPADGGPAPIGTGLGAWLLRIPGNESLHVRAFEHDIALEGLPPALDGLRVVHLSDAHFTHAFDPRFFEMALDAAARFDPDLVLFTGDLVDDDACIPWIEPAFGRLHGRLGSYAILGNHDHLAAHEQILAALEHAGYEILEGRWTSIEHAGARITLGGTSAPWGADPDPDDRPESDLSLLLCHTPDRLYRVAKWGIDLMFSGHNHGGQVRLPIIGPILMPSRFSRRFDAGFFQHDRTLLYVSRGLGAEHPLRFRCMPEIALLTYRCPQPPVVERTRGIRAATPAAVDVQADRSLVVGK